MCNTEILECKLNFGTVRSSEQLHTVEGEPYCLQLAVYIYLPCCK
jgi:hypothetical protein